MNSKFIPLEEAKALDVFYREVEAGLEQDPRFKDFMAKIFKSLLTSLENDNK